MSISEHNEPIKEFRIGDSRITVLGTAHVSKTSADLVTELLESGEYSDVAIELCESRFQALQDPEAMAKMDLLKVMRTGRAPMVIASLALGAFQQRIADQFGIEPGAEMRAAIKTSKDKDLGLFLIDREIGTTLKRVYQQVPWWKRTMIFTGLIGSVVTSKEIEEEEIEKLKQGDMLESTFQEFAEQSEDIYRPLIDERDQYMASRIYQVVQEKNPENLLAVVGAGHLKGIGNYLNEHTQAKPGNDEIVAGLDELNSIKKKKSLWKWLPWLIVVLILSGFALGFSRSPELGLSMLSDWVLINGALTSLGAILAAAHPFTIIGAFIAAPLTSLNPTIGAGMVTAAIELYMRKPTVDDFAKLKHDTKDWKGWWHNRVSRVLLVFFFCTLGSAIGTWVAGFRIFEKVVG